MYSFLYHRASSLDDARAHLSAGMDVKVLAGGQTLLASLKLRLAQPERLVDLSAIPEMRNISVEPGKRVAIGAMTPHAEVASHAQVKAAIPALAYLASQIGDPMVRNRGTLGGSLANSDPAADYPAAVLGLGARIVTDRRSIDADDFFLGMFETALQPDELITRVEFPVPERAVYIKFKHPASRFALVGVFVAKTGAGVRLAVTGAGPNAFRVREMEEALNRSFEPAAIAGIRMDETQLNSDLHASAAYRANLINVLARRAVQAALD